jgi:protein-S-isoprenylcysteine O-methyltransferase Ste14
MLIYALLIVGTVAWFLPFVLARWNRTPAERQDLRSRWGMLLEFAGFFLAWAPHFSAARWRVTLAVLFLACACGLSWTSTRALGRFLRFEAALSAGHRLIRSGPYRVVRHPIYASMLCVVLALVIASAEPVVSCIALLVFLAGTEIRVRTEDKLLAERFGAELESYRRTTRAYIPFVR